MLLRGPRPLGASPLRPIEDLDSPESLPEDNADAEEMEEMLAVPRFPPPLSARAPAFPPPRRLCRTRKPMRTT